MWCNICEPRKYFDAGPEYDRHLISVHGYDYCKRCLTMGPLMAVRYHIALNHQDLICPICCGNSPQFSYDCHSHIKDCHGGGLPCTECKDFVTTRYYPHYHIFFWTLLLVQGFFGHFFVNSGAKKTQKISLKLSTSEARSNFCPIFLGFYY